MPRPISIAFALAAAWAIAQAPPTDPMLTGRPSLKVFSTSEGVAGLTVQSLAFDGLGRLWAGTNDGAACYDGHQWTVLHLPAWSGTNLVRGLLPGADGSCWFGTQDGGLIHLEKGVWSQVTLGSGLPSRRVNAVLRTQAPGEGPVLWAATTGGVARFDGKAWSTESTQQGLPDPWVWKLAEVRDLGGRRVLWAATRKGLAYREGGRWIALPPPAGPSAGQVNDLLAVDRLDGSQELWASCWQLGLARRREGRWTLFAPAQGLPSVLPTCLAATQRQGEEPVVWAGFMDAGLAFVDGERVGSLDESRGLPSQGVYSLAAATGGGARPQLWIGLRGGGLARLEPGSGWVRFTSRDGLPSDTTFAFAEERGPSGSIFWAGTANGLARYEGGRWKPEPGTPRTMTTCLFVDQGPDRKTVRWVGGLFGLMRNEGARWEKVVVDPAHPDQGAFRFAQTKEPDGRRVLWVATETGIAALRDGTWVNYGPGEGVSPGDAVDTFAQVPGSDLLLAGTRGSGILAFSGGRWRPFRSGGPLPGPTVYALEVSRGPGGHRLLWAGTMGGLAWLDLDLAVDRWHLLENLPSNVTYRLEAHPDGDVYAFLARGVLRIRFDGNAPQVATYTIGDGLPSLACNPGASMVDSLKRVWVGTAEGLALMDPARDPADGAPPLPQFTEIRAGGKPRADLATVPLGHAEDELLFRYTLPTYHREEDTRFRSQLLGAEAAPTDWAPEGQRSFTALAAGHYVFRVWARDFQGRVSGPVEQPFTVRPAPWMSGWAFLGYGLALLGAGSLLFRWRTRQLEARARALESAVSLRTRELAEANHGLQEAQSKIAQLMDSAPHALENIPAWSKAMALDIARAIGAKEIGIYEVDRERLQAISASTTQAPNLMQLRGGSGTFVAENGLLLVQVQGMTGELRGALVVTGIPEGGLGGPERQLLAGFARQLGGALEMYQVRKQLALAEARQAATREEMHAKGVATLQVCPDCGRCYDHRIATCPEEGAKLEAPGLLPFRLRERYRFERLLGSGGMGSVYRALDEKLGRPVAIKLLQSDLFNSTSARLRFEREARAIAQINNPHVVHLFDSGELEDGSSFLVLEYLEGRDLAAQLEAFGAASPAQAAQLLRQGGAALDAAHKAGIVHRDVKPQNLFLALDPRGFALKILDFGLATPLQSESKLTQAGMVVGTPSYMAPEQVLGQESSAATDVYGLAVSVYEALTGHPVFPRSELGNVMMAILNTEPEPPSHWIPGLPPELDEAFRLAFAKRPQERPREAGLWASLVAELLEALPPTGGGWPEVSAPAIPATPPRGTFIVPDSAADSATRAYRKPDPSRRG